ncbi:MAG: hypothetical protein ACMXX6_00525 [Candidatus Woesearchaeota archaeon]
MKKTFLTKIIIILIAVLISLNQVSGYDNQTEIIRDVNIQIILDKEISSNKTYMSFIRKENLDHVQGQTDNLILNITYYLKENKNETKKTYLREINRFSNAGSTIKFNNSGHKKICAKATPLNFIDPDLSNNKVCKNIYVDIEKPLKEKNEDEKTQNKTSNCDCDFNIKTPKNIYELGEQIQFQIDFCKNSTTTYSKPIKYWIEDPNSNIIRNKINTTHTSQKTYTPRTKTAHIIKSSIKKCGLKTSKVIAIKRPIKKEHMEIEVPKTAKDNTNIQINLKGYKKDNTKNSLNTWIEKNNQRISPITRTNIRGNFVDFDLTIPLFIPLTTSGVYEIIVEGLDMRKSERIYVEGTPKKEENSKQPHTNTKIRSFYTRKQIFDGSLTTTLTLSNTNDVLVKIISSKSKIKRNMTGNTINANLNISSPSEIIIAKIYKEQELIDFSYIKLNLTNNEILKTNEEYIYSNNSKNQTTKHSKINIESQQPKNTNLLVLIIILTLLSFVFIKTFLNNQIYQKIHEKIRNQRIFR